MPHVKPTIWKKASFLSLLCVSMAIASHGQTFTTLADFDGPSGSYPYMTPVQGADGRLYGTTSEGGSSGQSCYPYSGCGTVFAITAEGVLTTLYSFCAQSNCADGDIPTAGLVLGIDGNFYGTTGEGGSLNCDAPYGCGTVFKITPSGKLTTLHSFTESPMDGASPVAGLMQATDGNFYGTTSAGGAGGSGVIFKITPAGTFTTVYSFNGIDGDTPYGALMEASDGNLYGTTTHGGANCTQSGMCGTVFKITKRGKLTTLYSFCGQTNCADGAFPASGLIQASDGNLYGTTEFGGTGDTSFCGSIRCGTVFKITSDGTLTTLTSFGKFSDGSDGAWPYAGVVQATDRNLYGTTWNGGAYCQTGGGCGTIFKIVLGGASGGERSTLYSFCAQAGCPDGTDLYGGLVEATNGNFYGATWGGGSSNQCYGCGTVFSVSVGLDPCVSLVRNSGKVGQRAGILGQGFLGTTSVLLNGTPAPFTVKSDTFILATVPPGATTGYVNVTTPTGVLTSNVPFHVIP